MNRFHTYSRCNKKGKVLCVIQYKFNILLNSPLASIRTNYTLLAASSSTSVTLTDSTSDTNMKAAMEADATLGKKSYTKTLYTMNLHLHMHLDILKKKMERNVKEYSSNILRYMNIYKYIQYIYGMS